MAGQKNRMSGVSSNDDLLAGISENDDLLAGIPMAPPRASGEVHAGRSPLAKVVDTVFTPLTDLPTRIMKGHADLLGQAEEEFVPESVRRTPAYQTMVGVPIKGQRKLMEFGGETVSQMTSPGDLALTAATLGTSAAAKSAGTVMARRAAKSLAALDLLGGSALATRGAERLVTDDTAGSKGAGLAELVFGLASAIPGGRALRPGVDAALDSASAAERAIAEAARRRSGPHAAAATREARDRMMSFPPTEALEDPVGAAAAGRARQAAANAPTQPIARDLPTEPLLDPVEAEFNRVYADMPTRPIADPMGAAAARTAMQAPTEPLADPVGAALTRGAANAPTQPIVDSPAAAAARAAAGAPTQPIGDPEALVAELAQRRAAMTAPTESVPVAPPVLGDVSRQAILRAEAERMAAGRMGRAPTEPIAIEPPIFEPASRQAIAQAEARRAAATTAEHRAAFPVPELEVPAAAAALARPGAPVKKSAVKRGRRIKAGDEGGFIDFRALLFGKGTPTPEDLPPDVAKWGTRGRPSVAEIETMARAEGTPITPRRKIEPENLVREEMFANLPEDQQEGMLKLMVEHGGVPSQRRHVQPVQRTEDLSRYLVAEREKVMKPGTIINAEETVALHDALTTTNAKVDELTKQLHAGALGDVDKLQLLKEQKAQVVLMQNWMGVSSEQGRALRAHQRMGKILTMADPGGRLKAIRLALSVPEIKQMEKFAEKWATLATPEAKMEFIKKNLPKMNWLDTVIATRYGNILSAFTSHARNLGGSGVNSAFRELSTVPAVGYDMVRSKLKGKPRTIYLGEFNADSARASYVGLKKGWNDALFSLQHGYSKTDLKQFDMPRQELGMVGGLGPGANPFNWSGRMLEAEDQLIAGVLRERAISKLSYAKARSELKLTPGTEQFEQQLAKWRVNPPDDVVAAAERNVEHALFREDPDEITKYLLGSKSHDNKVIRFGSSIIAPFMRVPGNMMRQSLETLPGGIFLSKQGRAVMKEGGRESAEAFGRMVTGTVALGTLAYWASQGKISGAGPSDANERRTLTEQGWRPNSIKIGNRWVDYSVIFQPIAVPLAIVANAWERFHKTDELPDWPTLIASVGKSVMDRSYLTGISDLNAALEDPENRAKRWGHNVAQSFVPFVGIQRNIARAVDPVKRDPQTTVEGIMTAIPGLSKSVRPQVSTFGETVKHAGGPLERGFSPMPTSPESRDPVIVGLKRLGIDNIGVPAKKLDKTQRYPEIQLTVSERQRLGQATKAAVSQVLQNGNIFRDPERARQAVSRAVQNARTKTSEQIRVARMAASRR